MEDYGNRQAEQLPGWTPLLHLPGSTRSQPRGLHTQPKPPETVRKPSAGPSPNRADTTEKGSFLRLSPSRGKNARYSLKRGNFSSKLHYPLGAARKPLASFQGIVETCVHNERNPNKSGGKIYTDYKQESSARVYAALEHSYLNMSVSMHSNYYLLHLQSVVPCRVAFFWKNWVSTTPDSKRCSESLPGPHQAELIPTAPLSSIPCQRPPLSVVARPARRVEGSGPQAVRVSGIVGGTRACCF